MSKLRKSFTTTTAAATFIVTGLIVSAQASVGGHGTNVDDFSAPYESSMRNRVTQEDGSVQVAGRLKKRARPAMRTKRTVRRTGTRRKTAVPTVGNLKSTGPGPQGVGLLLPAVWVSRDAGPKRPPPPPPPPPPSDDCMSCD